MNILKMFAGVASLATTYLAAKDAKEARADRKADRQAKSTAEPPAQTPPGAQPVAAANTANTSDAAAGFQHPYRSIPQQY